MSNIKSLSKSDRILEKIILQQPIPKIKSTGEVFHDLISCVIEQQIHYRSTKKTFLKMLNAAELEILNLENFEQFEEKAFGNVKLSANKYETIENVITFWKENKVDWNLLSDEDIITKLSSIKGVGRWTINMILIYTLGRPNVFPFDDCHLKQIMTNLYDLNPKVKLKAQMLEISKKWGSQKSLAVLYLLDSKNSNKG